MKQEGNSTKNVTSLLNLWIFFSFHFLYFSDVEPFIIDMFIKINKIEQQTFDVGV